MANVLNRSTLQYLKSANEIHYPEPEWLHNPDMSPVAGEPPRYWILKGDVLSVMDSAGKAAVDAKIEADRKDGEANRIDSAGDLLPALALVMLDEINALRGRALLPERTVGQLKSAIKDKL